jgi:hypothetical protein
MKKLDTFQKYLVEEFYDDYREGLISRRQPRVPQRYRWTLREEQATQAWLDTLAWFEEHL